MAGFVDVIRRALGWKSSGASDPLEVTDMHIRFVAVRNRVKAVEAKNRVISVDARKRVISTEGRT